MVYINMPQRLHLQRNMDDNNTHLTSIFQGTWISWYQYISVMDFIQTTEDPGAGDNWNYKTCKPPVKSSPSAKQHSAFYRPHALPVAQRTMSKH